VMSIVRFCPVRACEIPSFQAVEMNGPGGGVGVGVGVGLGVGVGDGLGVGLGVGVGTGVSDRNEKFSGLLPSSPGLAWKPKLTVPLAGISLFQGLLFALKTSSDPEVVQSAFQIEVISWFIWKPSTQFLRLAAVLFLMLTSPTNPLSQLFGVVNVTVTWGRSTTSCPVL